MKAKSSRNIWSIPIAVLALVLMLAGALAVSGIVQAQAANIVKGGGDVHPRRPLKLMLDATTDYGRYPWW